MGAITLQFVGDSSFGSELIEWYDHGRFSHVDAVLEDGSLLGARNDAVRGILPGVQVRPATYVAHYKTIQRFVLPCSDEVAEAFYDFIKSQVGKPYDKLAIMAFFVGANWSSVGSWFCSMLMAAALQQSGYVKRLIFDPNKIAPDDLALICSAFVGA